MDFALLKMQGFYKTPQIYDLVGVLHAARQAKSKIWDGAVRGATPDRDAGATPLRLSYWQIVKSSATKFRDKF